MTEPEPAPGGPTGRVLNPLWIISLFLGVSEVTVGIAATQADGWVQAMLATFSVLFPLLVSAAFFYTLWRRPAILYAPRDYGGETTVADYVRALSTYTRNSVDIVTTALEASIDSSGATARRLGIEEGEVRAIVETMVAAARESVLHVDLGVFDRGHGSFSIPVDHSTTVTELLDGIWFAISSSVPAFSYGKSWILQDERTGRVLGDIGKRHAQRELGTVRDERRLAEAGITSTSRLHVLRL